MDFIVQWIVFYLGIMFAMSVDNIFWISASPEYGTYKMMSLHGKMNYIFKYRVKTVLTNWRDLVTGAITSLLLAVIL